MKSCGFPGVIGFVLLIAPLAAPAQADEILVSAAASLTEAFGEIGAAFSRTNPGTRVRFNYAASGALQQQIMQGAPVDVFASASPQEMDALQRANRLENATRADFAGNRLVLVAPRASRTKTMDALRSSLVRRVALSNPASVPSGRYARETLMRRNLWNAVQPKAVFGENVRQTLTYVMNGDVDAGFVFATDARAARGRVRTVTAAMGGKDHAPIRYPAAVVKNAPNAPAARRFVAFLRSAPAQAILRRHGFAPAPR